MGVRKLRVPNPLAQRTRRVVGMMAEGAGETTVLEMCGSLEISLARLLRLGTPGVEHS